VSKSRRDESCRSCAAALTLTELVVAASLTAVIAAASGAMMVSASRAWTNTDARQVSYQRGQQALLRLANLLRYARTVSVDSATQLTIWAADDYPALGAGGVPGDDAAQVSETVRVRYDAAGRRLLYERFDFSAASGSLLATLNATLPIPGAAVVDLGPLLASPTYSSYTVTDVWAENVASVSFRGRSYQSRVVMVLVDLAVGPAGDTQAFHQSISLTAPAYFLESSSNWTDDGLPGARKRARAAWTW